MSSATIRPATPADAAAIHRTVLEAWTGTVDPRSSGHRLTVTDVDALLASGGGFVTEVGDRMVGSVLWAREGSALELMKLAVVPSARGAGIAPTLVAAVEDHGRLLGLHEVVLAVSAYSPRLVPWYESLGYRVEPHAVYAHASPLSDPPTVLVRPLT